MLRVVYGDVAFFVGQCQDVFVTTTLRELASKYRWIGELRTWEIVNDNVLELVIFVALQLFDCRVVVSQVTCGNRVF